MSDLYIEARLQAIKDIVSESCSDIKDADNIAGQKGQRWYVNIGGLAYYEIDFGKTVFLTREAAEQKLKEMNTDNGVTE